MGDDWVETTVGEFCPFSYGKGLAANVRRNGPISVYGSNGVIDTHNSAFVDQAGVIIGRKGSVGEVHFSKEPFWPIDTTFYVTGSEHRDIRFAYYLLKSLGLEKMNSDSAVPGLNRDAAHSRIIFVPSLPEQRAIAAVLGSLDDKIELNRRMNATLEAMAKALFKSWFVEFDPVRAKMEGRQPAGMDAETAFLFPDGFEESALGEIPRGGM